MSKAYVCLILLSIFIPLLSYYIAQESASTMSYTTWKSANDALDLIGKHVLVVGGTQGIGAGVAIRFSQMGASVSIAGRNETLANDVINQMKSNDGTGKKEFKFFKVDATMVEDLNRFVNEIENYYQDKGGVDFLIQTQGVLNGGLSLTTEGHDKAFMINSYSKWFITNKLLPLLKESSNPATGGSINFDDVELKTSFRYPGRPGNRDGVYLDSMTREFQERNPTKRFYHMFPGIVETDIGKNSGFSYLGLLKPILKPWTRSILEFADFPVYFATQDKTGGVSMNQNAKLYKPYDWILNSENRAKLWSWNENFQNKN